MAKSVYLSVELNFHDRCFAVIYGEKKNECRIDDFVRLNWLISLDLSEIM